MHIYIYIYIYIYAYLPDTHIHHAAFMHGKRLPRVLKKKTLKTADDMLY